MVSCQTAPQTKEPTEQAKFTYEPTEAKQLLAQNCYVCHSATAPEGAGRIAPPMVAVKTRYLRDNKTREAFVNSIINFVNKPTEDNAMMRGAVKKFGVMPAQKYPDSTLLTIASFMYDYKIEEPEWFKAHYEEKGFGTFNQPGKQLTVSQNGSSYEEIGLSYAMGTKKVLGKNLMGTIQRKGVLAAMEFCNVRAIPLTDSMAAHYNASIKRVSDKNRNPDNAADAVELVYLEQYKEAITNGEEPKPVVVENSETAHFYYPIVTNSMCLQCHGTNKTMAEGVQAKLLELYPRDKATGYAENEVRGMWSITFEK
ncbi:hypothetical protein Y10_09920 [Neptunitalea sp. Y10]|uniref:Cytochrome c domain-containing protein n=2 Tax=Neptunitalea lumnitzerae TaxID=2965509 RepID=A0ABQ5MGV9_9FLAO|nr:hypothetical protein Y10_09920 [Neptunitalea sp. Y10]